MTDPTPSPSPPSEGTGGLLSRRDLERLAERGEVDTVLVVFPDLYGRFMGKRVPAAFFLEQVAEGGMHACNYLLTVDMEMEVVPGYDFANWRQGYGDFHCVPDLGTLRRLSWLDRSALVICDLEVNHEPVTVAPRSILKQSARARREGRLPRHGRLGARVLHLQGDLRLGARQALRGARDLRLVPGGLPHAPGHQGRGLQRRAAPAPRGERHPRRVEQGGVGAGAARAQHSLRRGAGDGRPPLHLQAGGEGDRHPGGRGGDLHGEVEERPRRLEHAPAPVAVGRGRRALALRRRARARPAAGERRDALVPRRLDRATPAR